MLVSEKEPSQQEWVPISTHRSSAITRRTLMTRDKPGGAVVQKRVLLAGRRGTQEGRRQSRLGAPHRA